MALKKEICEACGADIRGGSQFCYNCGGPVTEEAVRISKASVKVSDAWLKEDLVDDGRLVTTKLDRAKLDKAESEMELPLSPPDDSPTPETEVAGEPDKKMKSASNMRRKPKSFQRKAVEIGWEEHDGGPNKLFPLIAFLITLAVIGIYFLADYMK
jgi:hypothetical protein